MYFYAIKILGKRIFEMEAGDLLDSVKFSEGIKKPSGAGSPLQAEGNYVIKASCRKKEARKTEIFLTLKKE